MIQLPAILEANPSYQKDVVIKMYIKNLVLVIEHNNSLDFLLRSSSLELAPYVSVQRLKDRISFTTAQAIARQQANPARRVVATNIPTMALNHVANFVSGKDKAANQGE